MGKKILLVEDDPIARKTMERLICSEPRLAALEPVVVQAASGQQGLAVFVAERPDLIITDLYMPAMDGLAFCRSLRETPLGRDVPIIVVSGVYKDPVLAESLREEVQAGFLPKPIQTDDLVRSMLSSLGVPLPAPPQSPDPAPDSVARTPAAPVLSEARVPNDEIDAGSLSDTHLPELIFDIAETDLTGTLALAHGKVRKDLYIRKGQVVAADSNLRQEALGSLLCARGVIDEGQLAFLLGETKRRGQKMGAVLIELGWLSPEEVLQALAAQARKRIIDSLRWDHGSYQFNRGDTFGDRIIEHDLDLPRAIFLGLYRSATPEALVRRFDQSGACPVELTSRFERYRDLFVEMFGGDISDVIAGAPSVGALSLREDAHVVMAEIDTLIETGLARLGRSPEESLATSGPSPLESSFSLGRLGVEVSRRFDAILQGPQGMSFTDVRKADVVPVPAVQPREQQPIEDSGSGVLDIGYVASAEHSIQGLAQASAQAADLRQRLLHEYLVIHGKSHYEILGVSPNATTQQVQDATRSKLESFSDQLAAAANLSTADKARLEAVRNAVAQAGRILATAAERSSYDTALADKEIPPVDALGAELAFGEALQSFQNNRIDEAIEKFEAAVRARPDQALYHAYLAWAEFVAHGPEKAESSRERLQHALALDPDLAEPHAMLGRLAATQDDAPTARVHLERSLSIDPEQPDTLSLLLEAYARLPEPDHRGAERFLRKLVSSLGERAEPLRKRLWLELGSLYETKLLDRSSARIAYDTAARLGPNTLDTVRKSIELNAEDPARWRETARALAAEWQLHPHEVEPAQKLLKLFQQQRLQDGVAATSAAIVLRGLANETFRRLADETRPKVLERIAGPLPADLLARTGYRPEESDLEKLTTLLVESSVIKPFARDELGLADTDQPLGESAQPVAFRGVLDYICGLYRTGLPASVIPLPVLGADARMADLSPPALLCGQMLLSCEDTVELAFRLGRAMALAAPGRLAGSSRSGRQMRPYFIAALALANATAPIQDPIAVDAATTLAALPAAARARIIESAQTIKQRYDNLNLSVWGRGLARVATRVALLTCGDLLRVGRAVAEEEGPAALDDLFSFALSLDYLDLRVSLGFGSR